MSEIDEMTATFEASLAQLVRTEYELLPNNVPSCKTELIGRVYECAGIEATLAAEVYAEIIDLATFAALHRAGPRQREETSAAIADFHENVISRIVELESHRAEFPSPMV